MKSAYISWVAWLTNAFFITIAHYEQSIFVFIALFIVSALTSIITSLVFHELDYK